jgi:Polyketide cyclase / dehydrase and lipid transport
MGTYRFTDHADLEPTAALFLWADLDRVTEWMEGVARVSDVLLPAGRSPLVLRGRWPLVIAPGSRYTLWFGRRPVRHEVLWLEDRGATAYWTRLEGFFRRGETLVTFDPEGGGSRVRLDVRPDGMIPRIAARVLATGTYRGSFRSLLRSFARRAERERLSQLIL